MLFNEIKNIRIVCNMKTFFVLLLYCIEIWNFCLKHYVSFKIIYTWVYEGALIAGWKSQCFISISKAPGALITGNTVLVAITPTKTDTKSLLPSLRPFPYHSRTLCLFTTMTSNFHPPLKHICALGHREMYLQEAYQIGQHHPVEFGQHPNDLVKDEKWREANI